MQELAKAVLAESRIEDDSELADMPCPELQVAAEKWAKHALRTYRNTTLKKALHVSEAIADFLAHLGCLRDGTVDD